MSSCAIIACGADVEIGNHVSLGAVDLYLISQCDAVVASKGSLGWFGACLSEKPLKALVMPRLVPEAFAKLENVIVLNFERPSVTETAVQDPVRRDGLWSLSIRCALRR